MRRILPDHESLIRCCGDQDWLLHAGGNSGELEPMEWNCQVRDLSELLLLLLLDAHLEDLSFTCGVHQEIADLLHARDREVGQGVVRRQRFFQVFVPFSVISIHTER